MSSFKNLTSQIFGLLTVIERIGVNSSGHALWKCRCDCGNEEDVIVVSSRLIDGSKLSCGCLTKEKQPRGADVVTYKHGLSTSKIYRCWVNMKERCYNKTSPRYEDWGGRGITICDEWLEDFINFYNWSIENGYEEGLSIDRIDNDKNYTPNNCRWVTQYVQNLNRRPKKIKEKTVIVDLKKKTKEDYILQLKEQHKDRVNQLLSIEDVKQIKYGLELGVKGAELGRIFNVSRQAINDIKNGKTYKSI